MLFFLTGDVQIGKTRWLMRTIDRLEEAGVTACGVIAPGVWVPREDSFEKLGIDNLLLPERETIPFARRRDLAQADGAYDESSQSARASLMWAIDDAAIEKVNAHFDALAQQADSSRPADEGAAKSCSGGPGGGLLVVDELGRLELLGNGGLTSAIALLERGATPAFPHALAVVRAQLLPVAREHFANVPWGGMVDIAPNEEAFNLLMEHVAQ